jgi:hypothetical protein
LSSRWVYGAMKREACSQELCLVHTRNRIPQRALPATAHCTNPRCLPLALGLRDAMQRRVSTRLLYFALIYSHDNARTDSHRTATWIARRARDSRLAAPAGARAAQTTVDTVPSETPARRERALGRLSPVSRRVRARAFIFQLRRQLKNRPPVLRSTQAGPQAASPLECQRLP